VFWFVGVSGLVFSLDVLVESGCEFRATLVSNNREGTEAMARDVVNGYEGVVGDLGQDDTTCSSGAV
jgi:hypothetical protein